MNPTVCLVAKTLQYPTGGGHMWVYLNWALGLRDLGCDVTWVEGVYDIPAERQADAVADLKRRLKPYGFAERVALWSNGTEVSPEAAAVTLSLDAASDADLLLSLCYDTPRSVLDRFPRTALVDIDPGLLQLWVSEYGLTFASHDVLFTTGETVGRPGGRIPDLRHRWEYTPPCVSLSHWVPLSSSENAAFSTITHWWSDDWLKTQDGVLESNEKRTGFQPYLDVPRRAPHRLELAMPLTQGDGVGVTSDVLEKEVRLLEDHGWGVRDSWSVAGTPWDYQRYIQTSKGEFSCAKPSCVALQNAWVSDRTLCYLASGKPAVVQHTGPSRILPDDLGLLRFKTPEEAIRCLDDVAADYEGHCRAARSLAETHFDAKKVARRVLERALS